MDNKNTIQEPIVIYCPDCNDEACTGDTFEPLDAEGLRWAHPMDVVEEDGVRGVWADCQGVIY
jgi:hypothetical protein